MTDRVIAASSVFEPSQLEDIKASVPSLSLPTQVERIDVDLLKHKNACDQQTREEG